MSASSEDQNYRPVSCGCCTCLELSSVFAI